MLDGLKEKVGPLPIYAWGIIGAVGFSGFLFLTRAPSRGTSSTPDGATTGTATPGTAEPSTTAGSLSLVEGELQELLSRVNGTGTGAGSVGLSTAGADAAQHIGDVALTSIQANQSYIDSTGTRVAALTSNDQKGHELIAAHNTLQADIQAQIAALQEISSRSQSTLSVADAAYVAQQTDKQITVLRQQFNATQSAWQGILHGWNVAVQWPLRT